MGARHALLAECDALERYLGVQERVILKKLELLIEKKDDVDYQYAGQAALKYWLFAHVPLTYSLLLVSLLHGVVIYAFSGDVR